MIANLPHNSATLNKELAYKLAKEIKSSGVFKAPDRVFCVNEVAVTEKRLKLSGWNLYVYGDTDKAHITFTDPTHYEVTIADVRMIKEGIVVVVSEDFGKTVVGIVYKD